VQRNRMIRFLLEPLLEDPDRFIGFAKRAVRQRE